MFYINFISKQQQQHQQQQYNNHSHKNLPLNVREKQRNSEFHSNPLSEISSIAVTFNRIFFCCCLSINVMKIYLSILFKFLRNSLV
ncbi:hypothetical protein DOY81_003570 [Sarcophaga bullata]|nr:hypothetical protein DOY81_003570 [Sarcophaga bullata]